MTDLIGSRGRRTVGEYKGFLRPDGCVGIRNHVVILPTVACVNGIVGMISRAVPNVIPLCHGHGCGRSGEDLRIHRRTLANLGRHPNIAAVLVIGLGCETIKAEKLAAAVAESGKPVEIIKVQEEGGSLKAARKGIDISQRLLAAAREQKRERFTLDQITIGLECGGSDSFSGVTANPGVGWAADWVVREGGTVLLTETTEMIGTAHLLCKRAADEAVAGKIAAMIGKVEQQTREILGPAANAVISPGNMDGGMSSIQEKSLGCIAKGGTTTINGVLEYGVHPEKKGLLLMDGPGYDMESMTGLAAAGAQVMIFTTGRGNPVGFPFVPVIKVASNDRLYQSMIDDMDLNGGGILNGQSLGEFGQEIVDKIRKVLNGEPTKAELIQVDPNVYLFSSTRSF